MSRALALLLALLLAGPSAAQQVPNPMARDAANAQFPQIRENIGTGACDPVAEFGADPTGNNDATAAINQCAALHGHQMAVRLPVGDFKINGQIDLQSGQSLSGSGRATTRLIIYSNFAPSAEAVIKLSSGGMDLGAEIRDIAIHFTQPDSQGSRAAFQNLGSCTTGVGGTGCKYPPAILIDGGRVKVRNIHISKAWKGIVSKAAAWFDTIEIGALDTGLEVAPAGTSILDWSHYYGIHYWPFGITAATPLYGVLTDGQAIAAKFGDANGVNVHDLVSLHGRVVVDGAIFWGDWSGLNLDAANARLEVVRTAYPGLRIANLYTTGVAGPTSSSCKVAIGANNSLTQITNAMFMDADAAGDISICAGGGHVTMSNSVFITNPGQQAVKITGAAWTELYGNKFMNNGAATLPTIDVQGGAIRAVGNHFGFSGANVGSINIAADSANHYVSDSNTDVWPVTFGFSLGGNVLGYYDLGNQPISLSAVNGSFETPGTSALTTSGFGGFYYLRGDYVEGGLDATFASNAYAGAAGRLWIKTPNMPLAKAGAAYGCNVQGMSAIALGYAPMCNVDPLGFYFAKVTGTVGPTEMPASTAGMGWRVGFRYRIR